MEKTAITSFGYCSSTAFLLDRPHFVNARQIRWQKILTASPLENWRRPPVCPNSLWMKTTQQDLKTMNLSLIEATDMAQNRPLW